MIEMLKKALELLERYVAAQERHVDIVDKWVAQLIKDGVAPSVTSKGKLAPPNGKPEKEPVEEEPGEGTQPPTEEEKPAETPGDEDEKAPETEVTDWKAGLNPTQLREAAHKRLAELKVTDYNKRFGTPKLVALVEEEEAKLAQSASEGSEGGPDTSFLDDPAETASEGKGTDSNVDLSFLDEPPSSDTKELEIGDIREGLIKVAEKVGPEKSKSIIQEFGKEDTLPAVNKDKYPAMMAAIKAVLGGAE